MTTESTTRLMTADELLRLDTDVRGELIRGVFYEMPPPGLEHNEIAANLGYELKAFIKPRRLGRLGVGDTGILLERDPDTVRAPDVAFFHAERLPLGPRVTGYPDVVPDLAAEVRSPNDSGAELGRKARLWLGHGVRLVWVVNPDSRTVDVYRPDAPVATLDDSDNLDGLDVLPGFTCPVSAIFDA